MLRNRTVYYYSCFFDDPNVWNSKDIWWGRKAPWHIFKYRPGICLVVQRKSKKSLCLFESLCQWLIHCVNITLDIVGCRRFIWCKPTWHLLPSESILLLCSCDWLHFYTSVRMVGLEGPQLQSQPSLLRSRKTKRAVKQNSSSMPTPNEVETFPDLRRGFFFFRRLGRKSTLS